ncbi:MAG TPA: head-tail connector protein [Candidatus Acidoferrales bacterium]
MAGHQVEIPAAQLPLSLRALKTHLRVDNKDDDELIKIYAAAALEMVEGFTGRSLVNQGFVQSLDSFPYYTDSMMSQMAYPPAYYSLPKYSTTLWNYSQMVKLLTSPLVDVDRIDYVDSETGNLLSLYPVLENWVPEVEYELGDEIEDTNGNLQVITAVDNSKANKDGTFSSGSTTPTWNAATNGTTVDGPFTWTNKRVAPDGGFFVDRISEPPRLFPAPAGGNWPSVLYVPNAVRIHYTAGYGVSGSAVPACAKVAMLQLVASWNENREAVSDLKKQEMPWHLQNLLWNIRVLDFAPTRG